MKVPEGFTEAEVLAIITRISKKLSWKFIFPPYEYDDVVQEGIILGLQGLERYDEKYPLERFLWKHMRRRLCTFKRDNYMRLNKPCLNCPLQAWIKVGDICTKYKTKEECELYVAWVDVTETKKNINAPISMGHEHYEYKDVSDSMSKREILEVIEKGMPLNLRGDWLKLKGGIKLSRANMEIIKTEVENILIKNNINLGDWYDS